MNCAQLGNGVEAQRQHGNQQVAERAVHCEVVGLREVHHDSAERSEMRERAQRVAVRLTLEQP